MDCNLSQLYNVVPLNWKKSLQLTLPSSLRKQPTFREVATWALAKTTSKKRAQKFHTDDAHYPDLGSASDWLRRKGIFFQLIRTTTKIWVVHVISMEFLRSLLRRRFARA